MTGKLIECKHSCIISTHTLTWSVTTDSWEYGSAMQISTHTLTWSVTGVFAIFVKFFTNFNSHAHVERDQSKFYDSKVTYDFNSHAHVERDWINEYNKNCIDISTHTLTWSVTKRPLFMTVQIKISTHTLTWSVTAEGTM